jgi:hypothetical protein
MAYDLQQAVENAKKDMEEAKKSLNILLRDGEGFEEDVSSDICSIHPTSPYLDSTRAHAPDDWIDDYCSGREKPLVITSDYRLSSIRVDLEVYSGRAVDWFEWIELFHALVHRTSKSLGEKLAILKRNVPRRDGGYGLRTRWR